MTTTGDKETVHDDRPPAGSRHDRAEGSHDGVTDARARINPQVLLVATLGGGGIHHYVEALAPRLKDHVDASIFDMRSNPKGTGIVWLIRSIAASMAAALRFPFLDRPALVHVHASQSLSFYRAAPYVLVAAHLWRRPVILHVHGSSFDAFLDDAGWVRRRIHDVVFDSADRVIVLSPYWQRALAPYVDSDKLIAIPNAVAVEKYEPTYDTTVPQITFVSHLTERKGAPELLEAVESLSGTLDHPFEVRLAGTGEFEGQVRELAARYDEVTYLGFVSEADKRELLAESDVFVLPTHAEGLPIALLEGMAGGNAVVTTPVGSIPEVVDEQGTILVEPGSVDELTAALERLITAPDRLPAMGRHNRTIAEERFAWSVVVEAILETYHVALEGAPHTTPGGGAAVSTSADSGPHAEGGATRPPRQEVHNETD